MKIKLANPLNSPAFNVKETMKRLIEFIAYFLILVISIIFGFLGNTSAMALSIVAGGIAWCLANAERINRIKGAGFEAQFREQVEAIIEKETELPFNPEGVSGEKGEPVPNVKLLSDEIQKTVGALNHPSYTWRYMAGLIEDTNLKKSEIEKALSWLIENGYARKSLGKNGSIWSLTNQGRYLSAVVDFQDVIA